MLFRSFVINLNLKRSKWSLVCPEELDQKMDGSCDNSTGKVTIKNDRVDLSGVVKDSSGHISMNLSGNIDADIFKANMTANLQKD